MIQIHPGDLIAVEASGQYYYGLILDRIRLFGGNWTFVFHISSSELMSASEVLGGPMEGFHAFVDFLWAKRENRLTRLMRGVDTGPLRGPGRLKGTHAIKEKAKLWFIYDMNLKELKRVSRLTAAEAAYPEFSRIDIRLWFDASKTAGLRIRTLVFKQRPNKALQLTGDSMVLK